MADAPEYYVLQSQPQHSTLEPYEPAHGLYKPPADSEGLQATGYQQGGEVLDDLDGSSSLTYDAACAKEAQGYVQLSHAELDSEGAFSGKGNWKKRRICGMTMPVFIGLIISLVLVGAGAIAGGVIGTLSKDNRNTPVVDDDFSLNPTSSVPSRTATATTKAATATAKSQFKSEY